ncbi:response regulator transcription factor [Paenibacillus profundus]|uniref:Response regulator transcription factor n=1 Tax=Paenibacillus profundus TaxID=1173085 RepID=A0ABS8YDD2_9BACL|nr:MULTISPECIES: response regulator transcription factor [Paenibacillus]MCE5170021.1 response regulator transcription factor [Paenibacillus profundus]
MQRFEENSPINDNATGSATSFEEGQFCETTRRVVIVSPFPASIRSLFVALTIRCYDVLLFHQEQDPVLLSMNSDLIIVDRTRTVPADKSASIPGNHRSMLLLHGEGEDSDTQGKEVLLWPCPIEAALAKIEELVSSNDSLQPMEGNDQLRFKDIVVDLKRIIVLKAGMKIELTRTEFDLLKGLLLKGGGVMTRQEIMEFVWGENYFGGSNSVDVHIKSLRQKLGDAPKNPKYIVTVRGIGYRIAD